MHDCFRLYVCVFACVLQCAYICSLRICSNWATSFYPASWNFTWLDVSDLRQKNQTWKSDPVPTTFLIAACKRLGTLQLHWRSSCCCCRSAALLQVCCRLCHLLVCLCRGVQQFNYSLLLFCLAISSWFALRQARQWPEVYDLFHIFCTLHKSKKTLPCENSTRNTCDSRVAVCFFTFATCKNVQQNLIPWATA